MRFTASAALPSSARCSFVKSGAPVDGRDAAAGVARTRSPNAAAGRIAGRASARRADRSPRGRSAPAAVGVGDVAAGLDGARPGPTPYAVDPGRSRRRVRERGSISTTSSAASVDRRSAPSSDSAGASARTRVACAAGERGSDGRAITRDDDLDAVLAQDLDERAGSGRTGGVRVERRRARVHCRCRRAASRRFRHRRAPRAIAIHAATRRRRPDADGRRRATPRLRAHGRSDAPVTRSPPPARSARGRAGAHPSSTAAIAPVQLLGAGSPQVADVVECGGGRFERVGMRREGPRRCAREGVHGRAGRSVDGAALDQTSGERAEAQHDRGIPLALRARARRRRAAVRPRCAARRLAEELSRRAGAAGRARHAPHEECGDDHEHDDDRRDDATPRVPSRRRAGGEQASRRSRRSRGRSGRAAWARRRRRRGRRAPAPPTCAPRRRPGVSGGTESAKPERRRRLRPRRLGIDRVRGRTRRRPAGRRRAAAPPRRAAAAGGCRGGRRRRRGRGGSAGGAGSPAAAAPDTPAAGSPAAGPDSPAAGTRIALSGIRRVSCGAADTPAGRSPAAARSACAPYAGAVAGASPEPGTPRDAER